MNKKKLISSLSTLLLVADMYVFALAPLADREGVGTSAEEYTFLWNTVLLFSPQFGHFLTAKESWKKKVHINNSYLIMSQQYSQSFNYSKPPHIISADKHQLFLRLMTGRPSCYITNTVFPSHCSTMSHFNLQTCSQQEKQDYRTVKCKIFTAIKSVHYYKNSNSKQKICDISNMTLTKDFI